MAPRRRHLDVVDNEPDERVGVATSHVEHEHVGAGVRHAHGGRVRVEGVALVEKHVVELDVKVVVERAERLVPEVD